MGRRERRREEKIRRQMNDIELYKRDIAERKQNIDITVQACQSTEEYVKHHITGEFYTALAVILRREPYHWSAEDTLEIINQVGSVINDLNEQTISDADLVAAGEEVGIRVLWNASHEFITDIDIFEEKE